MPPSLAFDISTSGQKTTQNCALMGVQVRETAGSTAYVRIRAGSSSGQVLARLRLTANANDDRWYGPDGIRAIGGVYVEVNAGTVEGNVYVR